MVAIRRILVATDFSKNARCALELSTVLAEKFNAQIFLLHVLETPALMNIPYHHMTSVELDESRRQLYELFKVDSEEALEALSRKFGSTRVRIEPVLIERGVPFLEIIRTAKRLSVDLIVMGAHGRTSLPNLLIGSVAEKVVRKAPCPVLTVKHPRHSVEIASMAAN